MARKSKPKKNYQSISEENEHYRYILPKQRHQPGADITLVIDGMGFAHTAYHAYNRLTHKGKSVSMIFGVPQMIRGFLNQYKPKKIVVCWDGMKSHRRMKWLPEYKMHRLKGRDKRKRRLFEKELTRLRILLYRMGITQAWNTKVEGDDMVYLVAQKEVKFNKVIILSGDKDMLQMVNWDINVITMSRAIYSPENFSLNAPFIRIDQMVDYLSMVGDHSDDIPGIRGIGPSKAIGFLRKYGSFKTYMEDEDEFHPGMMDKEKAQAIMKRNKKMIDIPWYCNKFHTKPFWIKYYKDEAYPEFNLEAYTRFCTAWNLKTMLTDTFKKPFQL